MPDVNTNGGSLPADAGAEPAAPQAGEQPSLPKASDNTSSPQQGTSVPTASLSLDELNKITGRNFTDRDSALKAIGDTFSFVGKKKETVAQELQNTGEYISRKELDSELFYRDNKIASENRKIVDAFAKANGITAREAFEIPELKSLIEKAKGYDDSQAAKSVIETNPKLASVKNITDTVKSLMSQGNKDNAGLEAARAIREAGLV